MDPVFHDPLDQEARRFQLLQRRWADLQRDQWHRQVSASDTVRVLRQPAQHARGGVGDLLPVYGSRLSRESTLDEAARGKCELDEHAHFAFSQRAIVDPGRHHATFFVTRRRNRKRGQDDAEQQQARGEAVHPAGAAIGST